jgi:AcrR family transcriptional regulator
MPTQEQARRSGAGEGASARERLLAAADELFYAEGVQTVGIDRIIERAGVAKASLYNVFGSKEALVRAYLDARHERTTRRLEAAVAEQSDPRERVLAIFDAQAKLFADPGFRGCAFSSASAEAPAGGLVEAATRDYRDAIHELLARLAADAGAADPELLASELHLVYDGVGLSARIDRDPAIAAVARRLAETLLDRALAG